MGNIQTSALAEEFAPDIDTPAARYGLPQEVKFCRRCVVSNQRPNSTVEFKSKSDTPKTTIHLDDNGICDACKFADRKRIEIDWDAREAELQELCDRYRRTDGAYDCVVPGSGGKDSVFAAHQLKYKYGMHPLTVTWAPHIYTDWGWRNFQAWIQSGFDNQLFTPNGRVHRLLTRLALERLLHPFQPFVLGQKNLAPKVAARYGIPLIFYGENEAEYGNPIGDNASALRDWSYFTAGDPADIFIGGTSLDELTGEFGLERCDLEPYMPVDPAEVERHQIEVHYLGYYLNWHPQSCYYYAVEHCGFQAAPERTTGTYSKYNSIDDKLDDFHYYTTFIKFGIGRATYDAAQEIRSGDITRDEGVALVRRFDGEYPERFLKEILTYLSIPESEFPIASRGFAEPVIDRTYFDALCDSYRSPHIWQRHDGEWQLRRTVWQDAPERA